MEKWQIGSKLYLDDKLLMVLFVSYFSLPDLHGDAIIKSNQLRQNLSTQS